MDADSLFPSAEMVRDESAQSNSPPKARRMRGAITHEGDIFGVLPRALPSAKIGLSRSLVEVRFFLCLQGGKWWTH